MKTAEQGVLLREIDEAVREDEMRSLWQRYGIATVAAVVIGLMAFGGYLWWDAQRSKAEAERGEQLTLALDKVESGNLVAGDTALAPLALGDATGTAIAAKLMRAGIALEQGKPDAALKIYSEVSADNGAPQPFRDLATIREMAVQFDRLPPERVVERLKPLAIPGNPWFGSAGELLGIAYLKQGKTELAGPLFAAISRDKDAPQTLRDRARQLAGLLGVDAIDDPEKAAGDGPEGVAGPEAGAPAAAPAGTGQPQ